MKSVAKSAPRTKSLESTGNRLGFAVSVAFLRLVLDACYVLYIVPTFKNYELQPLILDVDVWQYVVSWLFIVPVLVLPFNKFNFSSIFFLSFTVFLYLPASSIYGLDSTTSTVAMLAMVLGLVVAWIFAEERSLRIVVPLNIDGEKPALAICMCFSALFVVYSFYSGAMGNFSLSLDNIYSLRETQQKLIDVGLFGYLNLWTQKVFNPLILLIGLHKKRWALVAFALILQIYFFGVTQHRSHLVLPLMVGLIWLLYTRRFNVPKTIVFSASFLLAVLMVSLIEGYETLPSILLRRAFFVPPAVTFDWLTFFQIAPKIHWSDNLLAWLIPSQYHGVETTRYVGFLITGDDNVAYNSGIVGSGFANLGYFGIAFYAATLGTFAQIVKGMVQHGLPIFIPAALLIGPFRTAWADADLFASLLSHGILVGVAMLWLYGNGGRPSERYPLAEGAHAPIRSVDVPPARHLRGDRHGGSPSRLRQS